MASEAQRVSHYPRLDGFRGIAILLVMAYHGDYLPGGYLGVDLFFVLSGFLITHLLLAEKSAHGSIHLPRFYGRRALRLVPTLALTVGLVWYYAHHIEPLEARSVTPREVWAVMLYWVNLPQAFSWFPVGILRHAWSLAIEEHFYLIWPPLCAFLLRGQRAARGAIWMLIFLIAAIVLWRLWLTLDGAIYRRIYFATDTRADGLLLGSLVAFWARHRSFPRGRRALLLFLAGALLFAGTTWVACLDALRITVIWMGLGGFFASSLGAACMLPALVDHSRRGLFDRLFGSAPLVWTGKASYALYLIHLPVFFFGMNHLERAGLDIQSDAVHAGGRIVQTAISFALAGIVYHGLEVPVARLRKRLSRISGEAHKGPGERPQSDRAGASS